MLLTKKHRGNKMPVEVYYQNIAENNIASVVKGGDRIHNIQTMVDIFNTAKQQEYMSETNSYVLPMLKKARRNFTTQENAYENIKLILQNQMELISAMHRSEKV